MKAVVLVSSVYNPEERIILNGCGFEHVKDYMIANDFDLIAVESAVRLKEQGCLDEVIVFSLAPDVTHIQKALAMGADRAVYGVCDNESLTPQSVVNSLLNAIKPMEDMIWMTGKMGVNFESHATAQILADRLGCPCICSACRIEIADGVCRIQCEDDNGIPTFEQRPPLVVTADLRLAEPRFPSLPNIIKARKKPIEYITVEKCGAVPWPSTESMKLSDDREKECRCLALDEMVSMIKEAGR